MSDIERCLREAKEADDRARRAREASDSALLEEVERWTASLATVVRELGRITGEPSFAKIAKRVERETKNSAARRTFGAAILAMQGREDFVDSVLPYLHALHRVAEKLKTAEPLKPPWKRTANKKGRSA